MLAASLVAVISVPLTLAAQSANAGTSCTGKTAVGHGISASLCLNIAYSDSIGAVGLSGTTIWFTSNPLLIKCQVESTIYDYDTGNPASNNGATNLAQCTANADEHNTWTPNAALMAA